MKRRIKRLSAIDERKSRAAFIRLSQDLKAEVLPLLVNREEQENPEKHQNSIGPLATVFWYMCLCPSQKICAAEV